MIEKASTAAATAASARFLPGHREGGVHHERHLGAPRLPTSAHPVLGIGKLLAQDVLQGGLLVQLAAERLAHDLANNAAGRTDGPHQLVRPAEHRAGGDPPRQLAQTLVLQLDGGRRKAFRHAPSRHSLVGELQHVGEPAEGIDAEHGTAGALPFPGDARDRGGERQGAFRLRQFFFMAARISSTAEARSTSSSSRSSTRVASAVRAAARSRSAEVSLCAMATMLTAARIEAPLRKRG